MRTLATIGELRAALAPHREAGRRIGLVPTMGALHAGHEALIAAARAGCDVVVVSLFVNPTQFARGEDFDRYPRDAAGDAAIAAAAGADLLFAPSAAEMYPAGFATTVDPGPLGTVLEGASRPGHFTGVATVVTRLLGLVGPDAAWFGWKDYQQLLVIRQVAADLALPCAIHGVATVREPDGLARSSRNALLAPDERARAAAIPRGLAAVEDAWATGERDPDVLLAACRAPLEAAGLRVDLLELRDAQTLAPLRAGHPIVLLLAAYAGATRLIDNLVLEPPAAPPRRSLP